MILTITLILSALVIINFLLLKFSCNKTVNKATNKRPVVYRIENEPIMLAPTGS